MLSSPWAMLLARSAFPGGSSPGSLRFSSCPFGPLDVPVHGSHFPSSYSPLPPTWSLSLLLLSSPLTLSHWFLQLLPSPPYAAPELPIQGYSPLPLMIHSRASATRMIPACTFFSGCSGFRPILLPRMFLSGLLARALLYLLPLGCSSPGGPTAVHLSPLPCS